MSVSSSAEQVVERQAAEIVERAAAGTKSGTYAITHVGPRFATGIATFVSSNPAAQRAFLRYSKASYDFAARRTLASAAQLEASIAQMQKALAHAGLESREAALLNQELQDQRLALKKIDDSGKTLGEQLADKARRAPARKAGAPADVTADILAAQIRVRFLRALARLAETGRALSDNEAAFVVAGRKIGKVLGAEIDGNLKVALDYLIANRDAVKKYLADVNRLRNAIKNETDPAKLEQMVEKAMPAVRKSGVHSKLKGILGELYTARWRDWRLVKSSYFEIAQRLATRLGSGWEAVPVNGGMYLGAKETWDEAILLVNRSRVPPEAKLFLAAQVKAALEPAALEQTLNDIVREAKQDVLTLKLADGSEEQFLLTPLPQGERSFRYVLNAGGGAYPTDDIAALIAKGVQVKQLTLPATLDEFNLVANALLQACAKLF